MSEEDSVSSEVEIIEEKRFNIITNKENEMDLFLRIYNNDEFQFQCTQKMNQEYFN